MIIATPYASGFNHYHIADEVQFKFDRYYRMLQETIQDLPTFGVGHSLGSVVHLLIGSRYAMQRCGNVLMAFNSKDANLGSLELRRSSYASHDSHCDGPDSSSHIPSPSPQPQPSIFYLDIDFG
ncbi:hypothetical protein QN277_021104 [Acacia crassicarpa]|uniref:Uncharacterized protein n=1 Tax=Acacia crassicarpa TaxID=499986 RepID=A0AAE1JL24_9FABA|nr:hypothetical protein QN277_021104 [Acacia crassicarpa]